MTDTPNTTAKLTDSACYYVLHRFRLTARRDARDAMRAEILDAVGVVLFHVSLDIGAADLEQMMLYGRRCHDSAWQEAADKAEPREPSGLERVNSPGPLDREATIIGRVLEIPFSTHGEAFAQLVRMRRHLHQRDALVLVAKELQALQLPAALADRLAAALAQGGA